MVRRKNIIILSIAVGILLLIWILYYYQDNNIMILNDTDVTLSGLSIEYQYSNKTKVISLPDIKSKNKFKMKISLPDGFTEGSIKIKYLDNSGEKHDEYIAAYIEKGYHSRITVVIKSVDINGILSIKAQ